MTGDAPGAAEVLLRLTDDNLIESCQPHVHDVRAVPRCGDPFVPPHHDRKVNGGETRLSTKLCLSALLPRISSLTVNHLRRK